MAEPAPYTPEQLSILLRIAAGKLGRDPVQLQRELQAGRLDALLQSLGADREKVTALLNDKAGLSQLLQSEQPSGEPSPAPDLSALFGLPDGKSSGSTAAPAIDPALLGRIAQVVSSLSAPDRNTRLLMALQPFCGEHRRKKVEEAAQLLRIIRLLPLLEDKPPAG